MQGKVCCGVGCVGKLYPRTNLEKVYIWYPLTSFSALFAPAQPKIASPATRPKRTKPPTTPPVIAPAWLINGFEVPGSVDGDEVELGVEEPVVDVEVAVSGGVEDVLELNTLLLLVIKLLAAVLVTVEPDLEKLVNKAVVSTPRARS
jgi:hypothetical protein